MLGSGPAGSKSAGLCVARKARLGGSATDTDSLTSTDVLATEIADDPAALEQFAKIAARVSRIPKP